jgi:hypothetical protein
MRVIFERVDDRRYRIGVQRDGRYDTGPDVPVRAAPGHADVPHDLVHFIVEEQAGLRLGIYGQVAAGGDCGGFFAPPPEARHPARDAKRSARVGRAGRSDVAVSERLASLARRGAIADAVTDSDVAPPLRDAINRRLAEVLGRWRATPSGGRLVLTWPDSLTIRNGRVPVREPARRRNPPRSPMRTGH